MPRYSGSDYRPRLAGGSNGPGNAGSHADQLCTKMEGEADGHVHCAFPLATSSDADASLSVIGSGNTLGEVERLAKARGTIFAGMLRAFKPDKA